MTAFIIRNKETKEQWTAPSGKKVWNTKAAAKNAYSYRGWRGVHDERPWERDNRYDGCFDSKVILKFDKQDKFEIVELKDNQDEIRNALKEALELLKLTSRILKAAACHTTSEDVDKFIKDKQKLL